MKLSNRVNLSVWTMKHPAVTLFAMLALGMAGLWGYLTLGRAEDPPFTIRQMVIITQWPGASANEMMHEVTDRIERKLQELPYLDNTESYSEPGRSVITVSQKGFTPSRDVPDVWYQVRKKIGDISGSFPEGVQGPFFNDEFKDVFGIVYAINGDGFSLPELKHVAEDVRERFLGVPEVAKIMLLGVQDERLYIDFSYHKLAQLGLTPQDIFTAVQRNNTVAASGFVDTRHDRIFIRASGVLDAPAALATLPVHAGGHLLSLGDIATVYRGVAEPPTSTFQFNGQPALGIAISMTEGGNILDLGRAVKAEAGKIAATLPVGMHLAVLNDQSVVVAQDVGDFENAFLAAVGIVLLISFVTLGWRTGIVVAISVPLVLAGVFVGMKLIGIDLQRISLGAMIIALGLLVDDAIIAVETMAVRLQQGWDRVRAGGFAYTSTAFPMLTGTLVTASGYLPIGLARSLTGEYTRDIFNVVGLALILSWFVAVLFVPYLGAMLIAKPRTHAAHQDIYNSAAYNRFRRIVAWCVRCRWIVIMASVMAFALAVAGFAVVPRQFFPVSDRLEVVVDVRLQEGSSLAASEVETAKIDELLKKTPGVRSWAAYIGTGSPRFFLASQPRLDNANYAQFVINMQTIPARENLLHTLEAMADQGVFPEVRLRPSRLELGPPVGYPVQFRVLGPDPKELQRIAAQVRAVVRGNPHVRNISDNWDSQAKVIGVQIDQNKARLLNLSSIDIATTLQMLEQGQVVTQYREGIDLIPVVARAILTERQDLADLPDVNVTAVDGHAVPLSQIASVTYGLEQPTLWRRNRALMVVVRADISDNTQAPAVISQIVPQLDSIKASLPDGYRIETAGVVEENAKGQMSVKKVVPLMVLTMLALLMIQLQSFRLVAIVLLTAPLGLIGVAVALVATGAPFGFVAMLGLIALAGIIMRNSVILVDQIERDINAGLPPAEAIVEATVRRARPILLTAAAAILGLVPLAFSLFWGPMAIVIMGGLLGATVLTLCVVPSLYAIFRIRVVDSGMRVDLMDRALAPSD